MRGLSSRKFIDLLMEFGEPDEYISEFLRVHLTSNITPEILDLLDNWHSFKPLSIQLLGNDPQHFLRISKILESYNIAAINLNFGCSVPKIKKKGVGGALLKELHALDAIIDILEDNINCPITVKTRVGYASPDEFYGILHHLSRHNISALYLHARTVRGLYSEPVNYTCINLAKTILPCRVIVNGDLMSAYQAVEVQRTTGADGVMIGRATVANPWIFRQISDLKVGRQIFQPSGEDYINYIKNLCKFDENSHNSELRRVSSLKRYLVPIADFVDNAGVFSCKIRRATSIGECLRMCDSFFSETFE